MIACGYQEPPAVGCSHLEERRLVERKFRAWEAKNAWLPFPITHIESSFSIKVH